MYWYFQQNQSLNIKKNMLYTTDTSAYHHYRLELEFHSWWGVLETTLCGKVCQWLATGWWFSLSTPVSSANKTELHNIAEILLKVALATITPNPKQSCLDIYFLLNSHFLLMLNPFVVVFFFRWKVENPDICFRDICWDNFMYPLIKAYTAEPRQYVLAMMLISILFFFGLLFIITPWW